MRFRIHGKTYTAAALTRPTIRDYLDLARQSEALGRKITSADAFALEQEIANAKTEAERAAHPDLLLFTALVIWATLIEAGEPDPFERAIDLRIEDLDLLDEPQDHQKSKDPTRARAGSARAVRSPAGAASSAKRTSRKRSSSGS